MASDSPRGSRIAGTVAPVLGLVLAAGLLLAPVEPSGATTIAPDYIVIKTPTGNNLIPGACCRISPGGLPQHTELLTATAWNNGPNGIPQNGGGDDASVAGATLQWSVLGGESDTLWDAYSGIRSLTDSPGGEYADSRNIAAEITPSFNLVGAASAELRFKHHYNTESGYDYCIVEYKKNAGAWTQITSWNGDGGAPGSWLSANLPLTAALGGTCKLRFRFTSDTSVTRDGWHIDDVEVYVNGTRVFFDDLESGLANFTVQSPWGLEVPQVNEPLGTIDQNGLFTSNSKTGTAFVIASFAGAVSDTIDVLVVPPDWVAGP